MSDTLAQPADGIDVAQLKRALVIKLRHHGDVLLTSPVLSALKRAAPQCEIDAMVYADTAAMLQGHPALTQLHLLPRRREGSWQERLSAERRLFAALRERGYDLVVHCTDHPRGASLAWLLKPRWSVAFERNAGQWWWNRAFSHLPNGKLFPFGVFKFLWHQRRIRTARILTLGLKPGYQHLGLGAVMYTRLLEIGMAKGYQGAEGSWILEDNPEMCTALEKMGADAYKRYRVYERPV